MPMMKPRKRITKKQMKEDKFVTSTFKVVEFVQEHSTQLIFGCIVVIVIILAGFFIANSKKQKNLEADAQLGRALLVYQSGDYAGAVNLFEPILRSYGGTQSASQATFLLANCHYFTGNYDKALEYYNKYTTMGHTLSSLKASAVQGAAACHEQKGDYAEAARIYEKAANEFSDYYQAPEYLLSAGRCYEASEQAEEAKRVYQKIIDVYPESQSIQQAKLTLAEF